MLPFEFFPEILKGTNCPLGRFLKGQFQLQCGIGAMARPGSNPVKHDSNFFGHNNFCEENRGCTHIQGATNITYSTVVLIFDESGLS